MNSSSGIRNENPLTAQRLQEHCPGAGVACADYSIGGFS